MDPRGQDLLHLLKGTLDVSSAPRLLPYRVSLSPESLVVKSGKNLGVYRVYVSGLLLVSLSLLMRLLVSKMVV